MSNLYGYLREQTAAFGLTLDDTAIERLQKYSALLREWNEKMNLTAITDPDEIVIKHFLDCLMIFKNSEIPEGTSVIDVGTGAGFPGMVMKIARPDIKLTLLDSLNKRLVFLGEVLKELGLEAQIVHSRAEEGGKKPELREKHDLSTARAVAKLNVLAEYCLPYVKVGGRFIAMKGPSAPEETEAAIRAIKKLGGGDIQNFEESLPMFGGDRVFCEIKKISQTPPQFPRISAKIQKKPL